MRWLTGWSIGSRVMVQKPNLDEEAREFYQELFWTIVPLSYQSRGHWIDVMRHTIAFNTHRMMQQYAANIYV